MTGAEALAAWDRALDLHRKGELPAAEAIYRQLLQSPYGFAEVHYHLGLVELGSGRQSDALASFTRAIAIEPLNPDFHHSAGRAQEALGRFADAAASYARAIELRVGHKEAQDDLTRLQASHGEGEEYNLVSIITPTIGRPELARAIRSVSAQRYRRIEHLLVADGPEAEAKVRAIVADAAPTIPTKVLALPWSTGRNGFVGHRIIAAAIHLVNGRFVTFLDD
ncbi:MAG TPA: tetratricopeptide repeat protein, partial [Stellaceae bacterium]|nr:tetratricopeptide repeat protein [Stellaceae bacterium]